MKHAPPDYRNPFECVVEGVEDGVLTKQSDVFYRGLNITAFIASGRPPKIPFNTLIVPNKVYENIYELPDDLLCTIHVFSKRLATSLTVLFECDGVTLRQHNEYGQDVWHYHLHVLPRYKDDLFHEEAWDWLETTPEERAPYAAALRAYFHPLGLP
jgi:histidine triad (HIT) family protein